MTIQQMIEVKTAYYQAEAVVVLWACGVGFVLAIACFIVGRRFKSNILFDILLITGGLLLFISGLAGIKAATDHALAAKKAANELVNYQTIELRTNP